MKVFIDKLKEESGARGVDCTVSGRTAGLGGPKWGIKRKWTQKEVVSGKLYNPRVSFLKACVEQLLHYPIVSVGATKSLCNEHRYI